MTKDILKVDVLDRWYHILVNTTLIVANLAIFFGIVYAKLNYDHSKEVSAKQFANAELYEKRKNAIEAINKIYNSDFLDGFAKLKQTKNIDKKEISNAFNLVFNTYYFISVIYKSDIADNEIIKESIKRGLASFVTYDIYKYNKNENVISAKKEIDSLLIKLNNKVKIHEN